MTSKLAAMQARFQQKQMQDKEEKLLRLYENQQQRAFERVGRGSAGSNTSLGSTGGGKVRQLFEERRRAGVDKSYPLEPLNGKINGKVGVNPSAPRITNNRQPVSTTNTRKSTVQSTVQRSVTHIKNGKPLINKRETVQKIYNNNNGMEKYHESHVTEDFLDDQNNLVEAMNKHNLCDNLDDEESPQLMESGDEDLYIVGGKLANVGGTLPSQNNGCGGKAIADKPEIRHRSPVKPLAKKSGVKASLPNRKAVTPSQTSPRSNSSVNSSPKHNIIEKMATSVKTPTVSSRSPTNTKPSSKQTSPRCIMNAVVRDDLQECVYCGRRFAADRIAKHQEVCGRTGKKQRKVYDSLKHRVQGTELEPFVGGGKRKGPTKVGQKKSAPIAASNQSKKNWRRTHEEFIATIRSAKMAQAHLASGGKLSDLPPPPPSSNPDYVQCPSCGRRFNEAAAQRHIPKCASYEYNKPKGGAAKKR